MLDLNRVHKELREVESSKHLSGVSVELIGDDLTHLHGSLNGPEDTPYQGGIFLLDINLPSSYPFEPPKLRFITKVWHPNVSSASGAICLDVLKDQWSPAMTIKTALLSIQSLLACPQPDDPQDAVVASQYLKDLPSFQRTAKHWTEAFASSTAVGRQEKILKLTEMGFTESAAQSALEACEGDENAALEQLCNS